MEDRGQGEQNNSECVFLHQPENDPKVKWGWKGPKTERWGEGEARRKHPVRGSWRRAEVRDSESISPASRQQLRDPALQMNEGRGVTRYV